jgi:PAS domain S-box-containing protein
MDSPADPLLEPMFCQALLDATPDLVFYKDVSGTYRLVNKAVLDDLGLSREAILGRTDAEIFAPESALIHRESDRHVFKSGQPATFEYQVVHAGRAIWLAVLKSPVRDPEGRILGLLGTARNITTSKQTEEDSRHIRDVLEQQVADRTQSLRRANEKLRSEIEQRHQTEKQLADSVRTLNLILDNSPIGISLVANRVVRWANPRFHDLFARSPGSIAGQSTATFYPSTESFEEFGRLHYPQLAGGQRVDVVWPMRRTDGTIFFCRIIGQLLYPDRPQEGSIWLMEDVTERRLAEEAALATERLKREFMDTMSHELRTPLNGILGMAALLAASPLSKEQVEDVHTLQESAEALTALLENLLDFSQEAAEATANRVRFRPRGILDGVLHSIGGLVQRKGLTLTSRVDPGVPELVVGDAAGVRRVLAALVSNAVKFTEHGAVTVTADRGDRERPSPPGPDDPVDVVFTVADTGIGLSPEQIGTIFEPFHQVDRGLTRRFGGTGLGLTIARKTAEAMAGKIEVESTPGQGSQFRFRVRFAPAGDGNAEPEP